MKIKVPSSEMNRMMKTITQCIDQKSQDRSCVQVIYDNNLLTLRATNGLFSAVMSTPLLGGDGETFCVDGTMLARVCNMCSGEIEITTDGKTCTVKGAGRTRLPIVEAVIPAFEPVTGIEFAVKSDEFAKAYSNVACAISSDESRPVLTGILMECSADPQYEYVRMTTLDGFRMAVESIPATGAMSDAKIVVPGAFAKMVAACSNFAEQFTIRTDGHQFSVSADGMLVKCTLLSGEFPDCTRILPTEFKTECLVNVGQLRDALKSGSVVNSSNNLIKMEVGATKLTVMSNSEQADFDADIPCSTQGAELSIAFNHKYLMEIIGSVGTDDVVMKFNSNISPCVMQGKNADGIRLILPVRTR